MTNLFNVEGQTLTPIEIYPAVSDTVNYLTFAFTFDSEWDGLTKSAIFTKGASVYEVVLTDDEVLESDHVNLSAGVWQINVVGDTVVDAVVTRQITTDYYNFPVAQSVGTSGSVFPPSVASQVYVNVNQATPQTFVGGIPKLAADRVIDLDNELTDKKYVDDKVATVTADDFNHNDLSNKQGGAVGEYYHVTSAEKTVIGNTSGTNTGDQDVSGAISTHNTDAGAHAGLFSAVNRQSNTLNANALYHWRKKKADIEAGNAVAKIALLGDSIGFGASAISATTGSYEALSFFALLNTHYNALFGTSLQYGVKPIYTNYLSPEYWTTSGTWIGTELGIGLGKKCINAGSYATCPFNGESVDVIMVKDYYGASVDIYVDDSVVATTDCDIATTAPYPYLVSIMGLSAGAHTLKIVNTREGKYCAVFGLVETSPIKGVQFLNFSNSGKTTASLGAAAASFIKLYPFDITIIEYGVNDMATGISISSYTANLNTLVDLALANNSDVMLLFIGCTNVMLTSGILAYRDAMRSVAIAKKVSFVDISNRWYESIESGDYATFLVTGGPHPNVAGHRDIYRQLGSVLDS